MANFTIMGALTYGGDGVTTIYGSQRPAFMKNAPSEADQHPNEHAHCSDFAELDSAEPQACQDSHAVRNSWKVARVHSVTSTCSTADSTAHGTPDDSQSEPGAFGSEGDASLPRQVWLLSQNPEGSRRVQAALQAATSDEARDALAKELHGHVAKAMRCPHANHVLQKCIALMRPESLQFVVDELLAREALVVQAAKRRYACRVVLHTLGRCPASQTAGLVEALLAEAPVLACHSIGHYTIKLLLELGTEDQRYRLVRAIEQNMRSIVLSASGGAVVCAALNFAALEDKIWIARAVVQDAEILVAVAKGPHGSRAVVLVLKSLEERERERAREVLLTHADTIGTSKFGHVVAEHVVSTISPRA